jgi:acyl dehydratase
VPRVFTSHQELKAAVGVHLGTSDWIRIDQQRIDRFAAATDDHQWIHVDPERAAAGPYGRTIAHGYLTLSLLPVLVSSVVAYDGWRAKINYGSDKVRFPQPVPVDSRIQASVELGSVREAGSGLQVGLRSSVTVEGPDGVLLPKPALVAETLTLLIP